MKLFWFMFQSMLLEHRFTLKALFTKITWKRRDMWPTDMSFECPSRSVFTAAHVALKRFLFAVKVMRCFVS